MTDTNDTAAANVRLSYTYRDGSNCRYHQHVVLPGPMTPLLGDILVECMDRFDGEAQFLPDAVGLPAPYPWRAGAHVDGLHEGGDDEHHECLLVGVHPTADAATPGLPSISAVRTALTATYGCTARGLQLAKLADALLLIGATVEPRVALATVDVGAHGGFDFALLQLQHTRRHVVVTGVDTEDEALDLVRHRQSVEVAGATLPVLIDLTGPVAEVAHLEIRMRRGAAIHAAPPPRTTATAAPPETPVRADRATAPGRT